MSRPSDQSASERSPAADRVVADLAAGGRIDPSALATVLVHLHRRVAVLFPDLDPDDIVQSTVAQLLKRRDRIAATEIENSWGYLLGATRNAALDAIRAMKKRRDTQLALVAEPMPAPEDAIAALIDRHATHQRVEAALDAAIQANEDIVPIITVWLDMAEELGKAPSTREVAKRTGVSHTTVAQALRHFRGRLADGP